MWAAFLTSIKNCTVKIFRYLDKTTEHSQKAHSSLHLPRPRCISEPYQAQNETCQTYCRKHDQTLRLCRIAASDSSIAGAIVRNRIWKQWKFPEGSSKIHQFSLYLSLPTDFGGSLSLFRAPAKGGGTETLLSSYSNTLLNDFLRISAEPFLVKLTSGESGIWGLHIVLYGNNGNDMLEIYAILRHSHTLWSMESTQNGAHLLDDWQENRKLRASLEEEARDRVHCCVP